MPNLNHSLQSVQHQILNGLQHVTAVGNSPVIIDVRIGNRLAGRLYPRLDAPFLHEAVFRFSDRDVGSYIELHARPGNSMFAGVGGSITIGRFLISHGHDDAGFDFDNPFA